MLNTLFIEHGTHLTIIETTKIIPRKYKRSKQIHVKNNRIQPLYLPTHNYSF